MASHSALTGRPALSRTRVWMWLSDSTRLIPAEQSKTVLPGTNGIRLVCATRSSEKPPTTLDSFRLIAGSLTSGRSGGCGV